VDEKGNVLKIDDLKLKPSVAIEGLSSSDGFLVRRIIITTPKKKP
jgi:hypothetical protein